LVPEYSVLVPAKLLPPKWPKKLSRPVILSAVKVVFVPQG